MLGRYVGALGALGMLMGWGLLAASCGSGEVAYDVGYPGAPCDTGFAVCEDDNDCWGDLVNEPQTHCIDNRCQCPINGDVICNAKGHPPANNYSGCRHPVDCEPGEVCRPEEPPPPEPECTATDLSKCPVPPDKRCGSATCTDGVCALAIVPGPIASQKAGDCELSICDSAGNVVKIEDPSDYYDDGAQCTFDMCIDGSFELVPIQKIICPASGEGYCFAGACVQCVDDSDCSIVEGCIWGRCIPNTCANGMQDMKETDIDCGGKCSPCMSGKTCIAATDCRSAVCKDSQCQEPNCGDTVKNDGETGTDCGAACNDSAKLCGDGQGCKTGEDCKSSVCWAGKCQAATCTDGVQNEEETGFDCGGPCTDC